MLEYFQKKLNFVFAHENMKKTLSQKLLILNPFFSVMPTAQDPAQILRRGFVSKNCALGRNFLIQNLSFSFCSIKIARRMTYV